MRNVIVMLVAIVVAALAATFLAFNSDRIVSALSGPSPRILVLSKDLPPNLPLTEEYLATREADAKDVPVGAFVDATGRQPQALIQAVTTRNLASPVQLAKGTVLRSDMFSPLDLLQRTRGATVLIAASDIPAGTPLTAQVLKGSFQLHASMPGGAVTGPVGESPQQILARLPALYSIKEIKKDEIVTFFSVSGHQPTGDGRSVVVAPQFKPLDPADAEPAMDPEEFKSRLAATPGVLSFERREEVEAVAGTMVGRADVFIASVVSIGASVESHKRILTNLKLYRYSGRIEGADTELSVHWVVIAPDQAHKLNLLRRQGATLTVVPAGQPLPARPDTTVLCQDDVCHRSATSLPIDPAVPVGTHQ